MKYIILGNAYAVLRGIMQKRIKILCVVILFSFLLFFCGHDVMLEAEESNKGKIEEIEDGQFIEKQADLSDPTIWSLWEKVLDLISGGTIIPIVTLILTISNVLIERRYGLGEIDIDVITQKLENEEGYTILQCNAVKANGNKIDVVDRTNNYIWDMTVKIDRPDKFKHAFNVTIKKLLVEIDGYVLEFCIQSKKHEDWVKCKAAENQDSCSLLLMPPCVAKQYRSNVNLLNKGKEADKIKVYLTWIVNGSVYSFIRYLLPRKSTILFETKESVPHNVFIGIKRVKILRGRNK